jgi:hypothetical protein
MKVAAALALAAVGFGGARLARAVAERAQVGDAAESPYVPSAGAAPFLALGYRELAADLLYLRLRGYAGGEQPQAETTAELVEAIVALDPQLHRIYDYGTGQLELSAGLDAPIVMREIAVLERGMRAFPDDWRLPYDAGEAYELELHTTDPAQRRAWDDKAAMLIEAATRKPGAPANAAVWAADLQTKLGQHQAAIDNLHEILLLTNDTAARARLLDRLAKLEHADADELAGEIFEARLEFVRAWKRDRPTIPETMYVLLGPRATLHFDLTDLATGGHDLVVATPVEQP